MEELAFDNNRCAGAAFGSGTSYVANGHGVNITDSESTSLPSSAGRRDFRSVVEQLVDITSRASGVAALVLTISVSIYYVLV